MPPASLLPACLLPWLFLAACSADLPAALDTGGSGEVVPGTIKERCFPGIGDAEAGFPEYDDLGVVVPDHCMGTDHQDITGIQKVVFLGDSITAGTPPTPEDEVYRALLTEQLQAEFGADIEIADCSEFGARTDDLLLHDDRGIPLCFPDGVEDKRTLIIMTIGGNDMFAAAEIIGDGGTDAEAAALVDQAIVYLDDALAWIRQGSDPQSDQPEVGDHFPNGVFVVFGNVYEFTDATGDLGSCPTAEFLGFDYTIPQLRDGYIWISEAFLELTVRYRMDAVFMLEHFCGHGWRSDDPDGECYRGPDTPRWFDATCIHPSPEGHAALADMFMQTIRE